MPGPAGGEWWKDGGVKCADIADETFISAVETARLVRGLLTVSIWDVCAVLNGHPDWVGDPVAGYDELLPIPEKLVRAKARKLILRKRLDGCACGCRGDLQVLPAAS
jgi:hypothetical protein